MHIFVIPNSTCDRPEVLARAHQAGVGAVIAVAEVAADARKNMMLAQMYPMIKPAAGLYPTYLDIDQAVEMIHLIRQNRSSLVAIGEVGLDYRVVRQAPDKELQREIFKRFIELSNELRLPLNVHSRSAGRHAVALLLENNARQVHLHAFDGKASVAMPAAEAGYLFSIPPSVIRSRQKQKLVKQLPLSCLMVESDSPVLGPVPLERNEPANIWIAVKVIAQIKAMAEEAVAAAVSENTERLYGRLIG